MFLKNQGCILQDFDLGVKIYEESALVQSVLMSHEKASKHIVTKPPRVMSHSCHSVIAFCESLHAPSLQSLWPEGAVKEALGVDCANKSLGLLTACWLSIRALRKGNPDVGGAPVEETMFPAKPQS